MTTQQDTSEPTRTRARRPRKVHGPVYQSVCEQIRASFGTTKKRTPEQAAAYARVAGYVGSCRSLASSIDRATGDDPCPNEDLPGHDCRRHQVSGRDVAQLHAQLANMLAKLQPEQTPQASLQVFLSQLTPGIEPTTDPLPGVEL
jgi:hypothetical protein